MSDTRHTFAFFVLLAVASLAFAGCEKKADDGEKKEAAGEEEGGGEGAEGGAAEGEAEAEAESEPKEAPEKAAVGHFCDTKAIEACYTAIEFVGNVDGVVTIQVGADGTLGGSSYSGSAPQPIQDCIDELVASKGDMSDYQGEATAVVCEWSGQLMAGGVSMMSWSPHFDSSLVAPAGEAAGEEGEAAEGEEAEAAEGEEAEAAEGEAAEGEEGEAAEGDGEEGADGEGE